MRRELRFFAPHRKQDVVFMINEIVLDAVLHHSFGC